MAYETITVGELAKRVAEMQARTSSPQASYAAQIKRVLHAAVREWYRECRPSCLHAEPASPLSLTAGQRDYPLADDFGVMAGAEDAVYCTETPFAYLHYITPQEYVAKGYVDTSRQTDPPLEYCLPHSDTTLGTQVIRFAGWPSATGRKISYRYIAIPAAIDSAADGTAIDKRIPPDLHDGFVWGALSMMPGEVGDPIKLQLYESKWRAFKSATKAASNRVIGAVRQRQMYPYGRVSQVPPVTPTVAGTALAP